MSKLYKISFLFVISQTLEEKLQSQRSELDDLKEDMLKKNLDVTSVDVTLAEAGVKLEEVISPAPDMSIEIEFVVEQFSGYIIAVQEWGAWFGPALATLKRCREPYKNWSSLEEMNSELQVSSIRMHVMTLPWEDPCITGLICKVFEEKFCPLANSFQMDIFLTRSSQNIKITRIL